MTRSITKFSTAPPNRISEVAANSGTSESSASIIPTPAWAITERLRGMRYAALKPSIRLLITLEPAHSERMTATMSSDRGRCPRNWNCCNTTSSVPGGRIVDKNDSTFRCTKLARIRTSTVAPVASTGKNESSAEYAAPFATLNCPSSNDANNARRNRKSRWRRTFIVAARGLRARALDHNVVTVPAEEAADFARHAFKTSTNIGSSDTNTIPSTTFSKFRCTIAICPRR